MDPRVLFCLFLLLLLLVCIFAWRRQRVHDDARAHYASKKGLQIDTMRELADELTRQGFSIHYGEIVRGQTNMGVGVLHVMMTERVCSNCESCFVVDWHEHYNATAGRVVRMLMGHVCPSCGWMVRAEHGESAGIFGKLFITGANIHDLLAHAPGAPSHLQMFRQFAMNNPLWFDTKPVQPAVALKPSEESSGESADDDDDDENTDPERPLPKGSSDGPN